MVLRPLIFSSRLVCRENLSQRGCGHILDMWFEPREKFLIFHIRPEETESLLLSVDKDRELHWERLEERLQSSKFLEPLRSKNITSIITLHPSLAAVRVVPFRFIRQTQSAPLEATELENFLAQFVQKVFLGLRGEVSKELGSEELDAILIEARPFAYRADKSSVGSPLGHKSREITGFLELLFTTRQAFDSLQPVLYRGSRAFLTTHDKAELMSLKKLGKNKASFLEFDEDGGARLLDYDPAGKDVLKRRLIGWSPSRFFVRLEELWNIDRPMAKAVYREYLADNLSAKLRIQLQKIWKSEMNELFRALKKAGAKGPVYLKTHLPLPVSFPERQFGITLLEFPLRDILSEVGFGLDRRLAERPEQEMFTHLAPLIECYYDNSDAQVNHSLRRRIHWLIS